MLKRIFFSAMLLCAFAVLLLSGCSVNISLGTDSCLTGEEYPDSEKYRTGGFTYTADGIKAVEVYWRSGEVEIIESERPELGVRESGGELSENTAMRHLLNGGILKIRFCASGAKIRIDSADKRLRLEVPKGVDISVHTTSAPITADSLEQKNVLISAHSGNTELGSVTAESVDLSSSSGSIRADGVSAQSLRCAASSGDIKLGNASAETVVCRTTSGSVGIDSIAAETAEIETSSGDVELTLAKTPTTAVRTSSGKITAVLPNGGAEVLYTSSAGKLRTNRRYERAGDLYVFGGAECRLTAETSSGNLEIK